MSFLPDIIVYIWLLPVVSQILLPLAMLVVWLANKEIKKLLGARGVVPRPKVKSSK